MPSIAHICRRALLSVGGEANQWQPNLFRNTTQVCPFKGQEGRWNLVTAMADGAIYYMTRVHRLAEARGGARMRPAH